MIDHLAYATPDLEATVAFLRDTHGLALTPGGAHVGQGTRNHLCGLGGSSYLEVIGPDLDQPQPTGPRPFGVDNLTEPRLVAWCARPVRPLEDVVADVLKLGPDLGAVVSMSRARPDGIVLKWRLTFPTHGPVIPFCIDWGSTPHPADALDHGTTLERLELTDPDPGMARRVLAAIGLDLDVAAGPYRARAHLKTPTGPLILSS